MLSRLEYGHSVAGASELAGSHQPGGTGADHDEICWMPGGSRHRVTPDASMNLRAFGGDRLLNGGTR
jgi:hypothetical protein